MTAASVFLFINPLFRKVAKLPFRQHFVSRLAPGRPPNCGGRPFQRMAMLSSKTGNGGFAESPLIVLAQDNEREASQVSQV